MRVSAACTSEGRANAPLMVIRRRLDQYGVFDKQLFPDLDGIAKWLKYRAFEINGMI